MKTDASVGTINRTGRTSYRAEPYCDGVGGNGFRAEALARSIWCDSVDGKTIAICASWLSPKIVEPIQRFRADIYSECGTIEAIKDGLHRHPSDENGYHILLIDKDTLTGCARYDRSRAPHVDLGGWVLSKHLRGTRAVLAIIKATIWLTELFGDTDLVAHASIRFGSASILKKLGGTLVERYWSPTYSRELEKIHFRLADVALKERLQSFAKGLP